MTLISIYTDGASAARGGLPGGWAYVILVDGNPVTADYGGDPSTTNNRMELTAAIRGLEALDRISADGTVELVSDSEYVLGIAGGAFSPSKNMDLAQRIRDLVKKHHARTRHVRGHTGDTWNERCDRLAKRGKHETAVQRSVGG